MVILIILGTLTLITGMVAEGPLLGWARGVSIFLTVTLIIAVTSLNDYAKERQFTKLANSVRSEEITVIRGKEGATQSVSHYELNVGDIIVLDIGDRIPADCLFVDGSEMEVDEAFHFDDEQEHRFEKGPEDPFLLSQSMVTKGAGKALVVSVGLESSRGTKPLMKTYSDDDVTPLGERLNKIGTQFSLIGLYAAIIIFAAIMINWIIRVSATSIDAGKAVDDVVKNLTLAITIIVVALPEGLPLTVSISLAFSVGRMKEQNILVKNVQSPETLGGVKEIITGKTGTLTANNMRVTHFYTEGRVVENKKVDLFQNCGLCADTIQPFVENILYNSTTRVEMDDEAMWAPTGQPTEEALYRFLQANKLDIQDLVKDKIGHVLATLPHSSHLKRCITVCEMPHDSEIVRLYVKGAPEKILQNCTRECLNNEVGDFTNSIGIQEDIVSDEFCKKNSLRCLAFAYKEMSRSEWDQYASQYNNFADGDDLANIESDLIFQGILGLKDDLREHVVASIAFAKKGSINVRMVSGDHLETAKQCAI